jgi:hypothetical protein
MPATYQTVRLAKGKHQSPDHGVCVMELASMLAHEPFTDRPACVCPVIAGFLRTYNDRLDDERRQSLYAYAAAVVDSKAGPELEARRAERCVEWAEDVHRRGGVRRGLRLRLRRLPLPDRRMGAEAAGVLAANVASRAAGRRNHEMHDAALALVDELLAMGGRTPLAAGAARAAAREASSVL